MVSSPPSQILPVILNVLVSFTLVASLKNIDRQIAYQNLRGVLVRRKGSTLRGLVIGVLSGGLVGAVAGYADGNDPECTNAGYAYGFSLCGLSSTASQKAAMGSVAFGSLGGIVGTLVGAIVRKNYIIGGDKEKFNSFRNRMTKRVARKMQA